MTEADYSWGIDPDAVLQRQLDAAPLEHGTPAPILLSGGAALDFLFGFPGTFTILTPEEDFIAHGHEEPLLPLAERETSVDVGVVCYGGLTCSCRAPRTTMGCGGCCDCMGGCQGEEERRYMAPHVWQGDSA